MNILDIILIGVALSMDAFALTIANSTTYKESLNRKKEWAMPITFAIFQGVMPLIGYFIGSLFFSYVENYIGYITAVIFFILAGKIIFDIIKDAKEEKNGTNEEDKKVHKFTVWILLIQAVATSIDALAVGVTLVSSTISIYIAIAIIAGVTFALVSVALLIGKYLGSLLGKYATYVGAILLFALAVKNLIQAII